MEKHHRVAGPDGLSGRPMASRQKAKRKSISPHVSSPHGMASDGYIVWRIAAWRIVMGEPGRQGPSPAPPNGVRYRLASRGVFFPAQVYGRFWSFLVISGHFWSFLVISGHFYHGV